jgi:triacylglycerol lipase
MLQIRRLSKRAITIASLVALAACSNDTMTGPGPRSALLVESRNPILFVHGWNSSGTIWTTMIGRFETDGWASSELYNWSYNTAQSNAATAQQLSAKVDSILAATGAPKVNIITHSMGALSARYYIKNLTGGSKVDAFVSLGGPNHGTNTAVLCLQVSCMEMRPNSSFLNALNKKDETPGRIISYSTWRSPCDEVINPQSSTSLNGAVNTLTACLRHSDLYVDATVYSQVKAVVQ